MDLLPGQGLSQEPVQGTKGDSMERQRMETQGILWSEAEDGL